MQRERISIAYNGALCLVVAALWWVVDYLWNRLT